MKSILVTGGAGFIGSHLCEALVRKGYSVSSLDNYSTGNKRNHVAGVEYLTGETKNIGKIMQVPPDQIYHLGEYSRVEQSFQDVDAVVESNIIGTIAVLIYCRQINAKLIYAGSSTKFGDDGSTQFQSPYAWTKSTNTELVKNFCERFNVQYAITYFYNVYGGREISEGKYATLIGLYKRKMMSGEPLPVVLPGSQRRNFTYVEDVVQALIIIGQSGIGDNFGIGSDSSYTINQVADYFGGEVVYLPERRGNRQSALLVTEKTKSLGWSTRTDLDAYIMKFRSSLDK